MEESKLLFGWHTTICSPKNDVPGIIFGLRMNESFIRGPDPKIKISTAAQIFLKSPMKYVHKTKFDDTELELTKKYIQDQNIYLVVHSQYLLNFCKPPNEIAFAIESLVHDLFVLDKIIPKEKQSITGVVLHLGKNANKSTIETCIDNYINCIKCVIDKTKQTDLKIILETSTNGKNGSDVFHNLENFGKLYNSLKENLGNDISRIGLCIDTCHIFASGYNIHTKDGFRNYIKEWNKYIGYKNITLFHLNDSIGKLDSCIDKHIELGKGNIWGENFDSLGLILKFCKRLGIPCISETHGDQETEIDIINNLI